LIVHAPVSSAQLDRIAPADVFYLPVILKAVFGHFQVEKCVEF
jgi:hypothetical protein